MKQKNFKDVVNTKDRKEGIMKLQEAISITFSLCGLYFLTIFIGILDYPIKLQEVIGNRPNLVLASLFLFLFSYLISPYIWDKILKR